MSKRRNEETTAEASIRMSGAIESALISREPTHDVRWFYSDLSDSQLIGFHEALWGYAKDLRDEWVRRQMARPND